ncbi:unnamed protein product [Closterium sp. NIES-65]|nr:unnamed protein product [Closterium sp. NIES-65]
MGKRAIKKSVTEYKCERLNQIVKVGDTVMLRPPAEDTPPYVARVESIEVERADTKVRLRWFYRPEESLGGRRNFHGSKELFLSDHFDVCSMDAVEGVCRVHSFKSYVKLAAVEAEDYFYRFEYKAATGTFKPDHVAVYCVCEMPYNPDDLMVQCDSCRDWSVPSPILLSTSSSRAPLSPLFLSRPSSSLAPLPLSPHFPSRLSSVCSVLCPPSLAPHFPRFTSSFPPPFPSSLSSSLFFSPSLCPIPFLTPFPHTLPSSIPSSPSPPPLSTSVPLHFSPLDFSFLSSFSPSLSHILPSLSLPPPPFSHPTPLTPPTTLTPPSPLTPALPLTPSSPSPHTHTLGGQVPPDVHPPDARAGEEDDAVRYTHWRAEPEAFKAVTLQTAPSCKREALGGDGGEGGKGAQVVTLSHTHHALSVSSL